MKVRITGVALLACLIGVSGASAQTPTPDPAPVPAPASPAPPPVVEPTPTPTTAPEATSTSSAAPEPEPRVKRKAERKPAAIHPTFAETVSNYSGRPASVGAVRASAPLAAAPSPHGSPIVLVLVFLLGSGSLVFVALKDVRIETLYAVQAAISDHRGDVAYVSLALVLGLGIGLLATFGLA